MICVMKNQRNDHKNAAKKTQNGWLPATIITDVIDVSM